jgi:Domain of unknown function (DUF1707)/Cell wall-active antibiotics response 4TMS YvqF
MSGVRASDAERERTLERLRDAAGEGRLSLEELSERIDAATGAVTREQLATLTTDLPAALPAMVGPDRGFGLFDLKRSGAWIVPASSRWRPIFGTVVLDLRAARITAPVVTLDVRAIFGGIDLLVPEGVGVELRARTLLGSVKHEGGEPPAPGAPLVVLTGRTVFGAIRVRHKRLWEKVADRVLGRR